MFEADYDEKRCKRACEHIARTIVRPLALRYYEDRGLAVCVKSDGSLVSEADEAIERRIRHFLEEAFPRFGLVGEELPAVRSDNEYVWTIDPLDGTEAFAARLPLFGTLLAVIRQTSSGARTAVLGAIYLPMQDTLIIGTGRETTMNGAVVRMPVPPVRGACSLILGNVSAIARNMTGCEQSRLLSLAREFRTAQTWGDCAGYANMLEGKAHARVEAGLGVDDIAPLEPIIVGAGGAISTLEGTSLSQALSALPDLADPAAAFMTVCAANPELHDELMRALSEEPPAGAPAC